jgi:hypothetical protein
MTNERQCTNTNDNINIVIGLSYKEEHTITTFVTNLPENLPRA